MADDPQQSTKRVLEPTDRISEGLFGLIMVLTFTGSLSIAEAGRDDVRAMLIGALGCNIAWGIIDAVLYLMGCMAERNRADTLVRAIRSATDPEQARRALAAELPGVASVLEPAEMTSIRQRLLQRPEPPRRARLGLEDWQGAAGVFLLVFLTTFPVAIPFLVMASAGPALRISNLIAIVMLFLLGCAFGRITGHRSWPMGAAMVALGVALVSMTMALGG
ncbi:MAG TPA: VIT1/CCC1 transporter family protein [Planctomycetota bacterium]|nr:VIT1/CCC1 transporter family protein [Planctomycetota bacterium]